MKVATLIVAFLKDGQLHAVRYVKQLTLGWCGVDSGDSNGIYYVPAWAFDGRAKHDDVNVCLKCSAALCALAEPQ